LRAAYPDSAHFGKMSAGVANGKNSFSGYSETMTRFAGYPTPA
jgi:hypothetical protein